MAVWGLVMTGCGGADDADTVLVFVAASLHEVAAEVEIAFEEANPGVDVQLNVAGSTTLREQILEGAPADVFVPADEDAMTPIVVAGYTTAPPVTLAVNRMAIGVPLDDPGGVRGLADLARPELLVGLCAAEVPCGALARQVLAAAGVEASIDTDEPDVGALRTKLAVGELDAGIVYRTDVLAEPAITGIEIPDEVNAVATYPIAPLDDGAALELVAFMTGDEGRRILVDHGFGVP